MTQPEGFISRNDNKVCKLQRPIYGLKQVSRSWNIQFDETIKEFSFSQNPTVLCVYKKVSRSVFLLLYLDNCIVHILFFYQFISQV